MPGAGKSTRATSLAEKTGYRIVNRDELKTRSRYLKAIDQELGTGNSVIADATNFTTIEDLEALAKKHNAELIIQFIDTPVDECIARDYQRDPVERTGAAAIRGMFNAFLKERADQ